MMRSTVFATFAAVLAVAQPARAVDEEIYRAMAGRWLVAPEAGGRGCILTLRTNKTIGGRQIDGAEVCQGAVAGLQEAAAWDLDEGGLVFRNALRKRVLGLREQEDATYRQEAAPGKALLMVPAVGTVDRIPNARDVFGSWDLRRPGGPVLCTVGLLDRPPPGGEESYGLTLSKSCDAAIQRLKLASWRIEGLDLVLYGTDGASLAFTPRGDGAFAKAAREGGKPLDLVRTR